MSFLSKQLSPSIKQYLLITINYWAFTLTDGALRMLVVLYFHQLGYSPLNIAFLFLFYEFFGVITNLVGGWLGVKLGLNKTMNIGLFIQIIALAMLTIPSEYLSVIYVMMAQALSGIAKDLNKMSAKSAVKLLIPDEKQGLLYQWVAFLTGSKNTLKGVGFFLGGLLLTVLGFTNAIISLASALSIILMFSLFTLQKDLGKAKNKPKFTHIFSKSASINILSATRMFLFAARDVWFVVALPVFLATKFNWNYWLVSSFMASWIIGYGIIQTIAPYITGTNQNKTPTANLAMKWVSYLTLIQAIIALALQLDFYLHYSIIIGLFIFGAIFAINSSLHSYLIVSYADKNTVSLDVGFYYMANAMGRLIGTILSGFIYQKYGLEACLWISSGFLAISTLLSSRISPHKSVL